MMTDRECALVEFLLASVCLLFAPYMAILPFVLGVGNLIVSYG